MLWWVAGVVGALLLAALLAPPAPGRRTLSRMDFGDETTDKDESQRQG
ncbi:MAG: hypothetical protein JNJ92_12260 [Altererythrobacter sp.]|uniref:Uncharacterized protein n=1 Tax=Sphingosinicella xenopeptidilytica TaxID=364098 RepID=A0ABW3C3K8_SPHXN|nr:hypothetical protein [Altererythrobacter sp.]